MKSYVFVINKFWAHQTFCSLYIAPCPKGVTLAIVKQSLI